MPDAPKRVPLSGTSIAREVFGSLSGIVFIGAVRSTPSIDSHFASRVQEFADVHRVEIERVLVLVKELADLLPETVAMYYELEAGWQGLSADEAGSWLAFYGRMRDQPDAIAEPGRRARLTVHALDVLLTDFVGALAKAATDRGHDDAEGGARMREAVLTAAGLGGAPHPEAAANAAYRTWSVARLSEILKPDSHATDAARDSLRTLADRLDPMFARFA